MGGCWFFFRSGNGGDVYAMGWGCKGLAGTLTERGRMRCFGSQERETSCCGGPGSPLSSSRCSNEGIPIV